MRNYRVEWIFAIISLSLFAALCVKLSPGPKLSHSEVTAFVTKLEQGLTMPEPDKSEFIARLQAWGEADDGKPVYLMNLIRYREHVTAWPGHDISALSAREAHAVYLKAVIPLVLKMGTYPVFGSDMQGMIAGTPARNNLAGFDPELDGWSEININRYTSRRSLLALLSSPEYMAVMPYKFAAMNLVTAPVTPRLAIPDPRFILGSVLLIVFLLVAWLRCAQKLRATTH
ncbi:MAG: hypothetical protein ACSHWQ_08105 [Spongiibacteraceae bacterium]